VREELIPIFLSALTTAVGFLTFLVSSLEAFRQLVIMVSLGIMLSSALVLGHIPAFLFFRRSSCGRKKAPLQGPNTRQNNKGRQNHTHRDHQLFGHLAFLSL
jgi:predicted RND superfamily exporter protein